MSDGAGGDGRSDGALVLAAAQPEGAAARLETNVDVHARLVERAAAHRADLVLFPELSLTGYHLGYREDDAVDPRDPRLAKLRRLADEKRVVILAGAPIRSAGGLHIGAIRFAPGGRISTYAKCHLGGDELRAFVPGDGGDPIAIGRDLVACAICADVGHPDHAAAAARTGATIYAAGCLLDAEGYASDEARLVVHARTHGLVAMLANFAPPVPDWAPVGRSAIWSGSGERLAVAPADREAVVVARRAGGAWSGTVLA